MTLRHAGKSRGRTRPCIHIEVHVIKISLLIRVCCVIPQVREERSGATSNREKYRDDSCG